MRYIFFILLSFPILGLAQGKFFGGDGPSSYAGGSLLIVVLHVDYGYLQANTSGSSIELEWSTFTEVNNDYFDIQRMNSEGEFSSIGKVNGNGSTKELHTYKFIDLAPIIGLNHYQVHQVDFDGARHDSKTITTTFLPSPIKIFPNPAFNKLYLSPAPQGTQLEIYSMDGRLVLSQPSSSVTNIEGLERGQYLLKIYLGSTDFTVRFIKL